MGFWLAGISMEGDGELLVATKVKPVFKRDEWMATLLHERKARVHAFSRNARDTTVWTDTHMNKAQRGKTNQRHIGPRYRFLYLLMFCPLVLLAWTSSAEATKQHDSEPEEKNVVLIVCLVILFGILMSLLIQFLSWLDSKPKSMPKSEKSNVGKTSNGQSSSQNPKQAGKPKIKRKRKGKSSSQEEEDELDHLNGQDSNVYTKSEQTSNGQSSSQNTEEAVDVSEPKAGTFVYQKDWDKRTTNVFVTETMVERRNGLEVVEGSLQGRQVYVKRGAARSEEMVNEILVLQEADFHPNIIRYFFFEEKGEFFTYCVEPWICSLRYLIKIGDNKQSPPSSQINLLDVMVKLRQPSLWETLLINIMRDVLLGIEHLHSLNIIHGDLTPDNIRIINNQKTLIGKIDGMGIARAENRPFLPSRIRDKKSEVFQPADQIDKAEYSSAVDMFALGCLIFHCLSSGKHPFGSGGGVRNHESNIRNNRCDLRAIETFPEAHDLVKRLVNVEPNSRPTASETKLHPFFWNDGVKCEFFKVVRKQLYKLGLSELNKEATVAKALGGDASWFTKLPNAFLKHLDKNSIMNLHAPSTSYIHMAKTYDGTLLSDLIEVIRNNEEHYQELPKHIKNLFPDGVYIYFQRMFPHLFMVVYDFIYGGPCKEKKEFREFFKEIAHFKVVEM